MSDNTAVLENGAISGGQEQSLKINANLIRGHIDTIILRCLYDGDKYGYEIISEISKKSGGLYQLKQPTLYSALDRLADAEYVRSYMGEFSSGAPRKYFSLTDLGRELIQKNLSEWEFSRTIIDSLISDGDAHFDFSFITEKQKELDELKRALSARENALQEERSALQSLKNELQRERSLLSTQSASLTSQKSDFTELRSRLDAQSAELEEKVLVLNEKQGEIEAKELELQAQAREMELTKEQLAALQSELSQAHALNEELQERNRLLLENGADKEELESVKAKLAATLLELEQKQTEFYNRSLELRAQQAQIENDRAKTEAEKQALAEKTARLDELSQALSDRELAIKTAMERMSEESAADLEEERNELKNQLQILEVERDTLRADNKALEDAKALLETEKAQLQSWKDSLKAERDELDKKSYELNRQEYALEEKQRIFDGEQCSANVTAEETQRRLANLAQRETDLLKSTQKLEEDILALDAQEKELAARQNIYNQQQLEFITRKNALTSQQYDYAEKMNAYNLQIKQFNENLERLESEKRAFESVKTQFAEEKTALENERMEMQKKAANDASILQIKTQELQDRERLLTQREANLHDQMRNQNAYPYRPAAHNPYYSPYGNDLASRAQADGVRLNTAGAMRGTQPPEFTQAYVEPKTTAGRYNVGLTLFKSAFITFCIILFECIAVFFAKEYLGVNILYPVAGLAGGALVFLVCAILYLRGYKPNAKRKKNPSYWATSSVLFVISVILITMIAVYCKADLTHLPTMLASVLIPIGYALNLLLFVSFYHVLSKKENAQES